MLFHAFFEVGGVLRAAMGQRSTFNFSFTSQIFGCMSSTFLWVKSFLMWMCIKSGFSSMELSRDWLFSEWVDRWNSAWFSFNMAMFWMNNNSAFSFWSSNPSTKFYIYAKTCDILESYKLDVLFSASDSDNSLKESIGPSNLMSSKSSNPWLFTSLGERCPLSTPLEYFSSTFYVSLISWACVSSKEVVSSRSVSPDNNCMFLPRPSQFCDAGSSFSMMKPFLLSWRSSLKSLFSAMSFCKKLL